MMLSVPRGLRTRPATSRIRQWIFDVLGPPVGLDVLDLFAGSGAVGIEALSRGASSALFVESSSIASAAIEANLRRTGYADRAEVRRQDARRCAALLKEGGRRFGICFCDPPYGWQGLEELLAQSVLDLLAPQGTLVVEHRGEVPLVPRGLEPGREKRFGDTLLSLWTNDW